MTEWDAGRIYTSGQPVVTTRAELTRDSAERKFSEFIRQFRSDANTFPYRDQLQQRYYKHEHHLEVDIADLASFNQALHDELIANPNEAIPTYENGIRLALTSIIGRAALADQDIPYLQLVLLGRQVGKTQIRNISSSDVNQLLRIPGIVINASRTRPKATRVAIRCSSCDNRRDIPCSGSFAGVQLPRVCDALSRNNPDGAQNPSDARCPMDPFVIVPDQSMYVDQQTLKLQEAPEDVLTGEMPRHMLLAVERSLVDRVAPGTRVTVLGIVSVVNTAAKSRRQDAAAMSVRTPYLRVVGIMVENEAGGRGDATFTPEEEEEFRDLASTPNFLQRLCDSVAPSISGDYTKDIKKAILCLLLGGTRKILPDGMRLRGDINVLLLGDPSTAKSQFLKFVERVAPVGVYTSGKGSSAAGLTASVIRNAQGEFSLEGGAMVLADGGVVCIDEFDKMREEDRVAIHEAMEQQTISVAKAGITTILNSRAAVLAAANPVFGRYDDMRSAAENIDFLPSILSRFDLIFIVRDVRNEQRDMEIARHVMGIHINALDTSAAANEADIDLLTMKRYITFARNKCAPHLTADGAKSLADNYVKIRAEQRRTTEGAGEDDGATIPITVRQLEALVRISEALAKVTLAREVTGEHVAEAMRLFKVSTLNAAHSGIGTYMSAEQRVAVQKAETDIQRRVPISSRKNTGVLFNELRAAGHAKTVIDKALAVMIKRGEVVQLGEGRFLERRQ